MDLRIILISDEGEVVKSQVWTNRSKILLDLCYVNAINAINQVATETKDFSCIIFKDDDTFTHMIMATEKIATFTPKKGKVFKVIQLGKVTNSVAKTKGLEYLFSEIAIYKEERKR